MIIHRMSNGESLYDVAERYDVPVSMLCEHNGIETPRYRGSERELVVIQPTRVYNVHKGDTLDSIAERFKISKDELWRNNPELCGSERLYTGQLIALRLDAPRYGMAASNGYCYGGIDKRRLHAMLPYTDYVTVCSARADGCDIHSLFDDKELVNDIHRRKKCPILRIYISHMPPRERIGDLVSGIVLLAKARSYGGIAIGGISGHADAPELTLRLKNALGGEDILVVAEASLTEGCEHVEYADMSVVICDRLSLGGSVSFADGERRALTEFATEHSAMSAVVELPSFAAFGDGFIERERAVDAMATARTREFYPAALTVGGEYRGKRLTMESVENTKAKLECLSELGFMGISFDMMRVPLCEVMMFTAMFSPLRTDERNFKMPYPYAGI